MTINDPMLRRIAQFSPQDVLLADVAIRVQLSPTDYLLATKHYEVMAEWIDRPGSPLRGRVVGFYPQGGFSTGSAVAAHTERSDFDLDAMAAIDWPLAIDPETALATLHYAIAGEKGSRYYEKAHRMTRCTQIVYENMHLDVTPSILLPIRDPKTSLIFHSKPSDPTVPKQRLYANPYGLAEWFNSRTSGDLAFPAFFERESLNYDRALARMRADTTDVPEQMPAFRKSRQVICLQLLKRWRNIAYERRHPKLRLPPSVLLTYYIGEHAGADRTLLDELIHHVTSIIGVIEAALNWDRLVVARNPKCAEDILTDRWPGISADQRIFRDELQVLVGKLYDLKRGVSVPRHGFETALCAGHAASLDPVAASVSRPSCSARI